MKKKKANSKAAEKKTAKKSKKKTVKKDLNPQQVLKDISALVEAEAEELAAAVIGEGKKGQLSPVKFLFEMAHIFPPTGDESTPTEDEESLAKTLLNRLNIPLEPVVHDLLQKEEDEDVMTIEPVQEKVEESAGENGDEVVAE